MLTAKPDNIDGGIAFVKNEAAPTLHKIDGCLGLSMLVDRENGKCIVTSSWESEAAMRASDEQLRPIRDRGRDIFGGSIQVDSGRSPSCTALSTAIVAESAGCRVTSTP